MDQGQKHGCRNLLCLIPLVCDRTEIDEACVRFLLSVAVPTNVSLCWDGTFHLQNWYRNFGFDSLPHGETVGGNRNAYIFANIICTIISLGISLVMHSITARSRLSAIDLSTAISMRRCCIDTAWQVIAEVRTLFTRSTSHATSTSLCHGPVRDPVQHSHHHSFRLHADQFTEPTWI